MLGQEFSLGKDALMIYYRHEKMAEANLMDKN